MKKFLLIFLVLSNVVFADPYDVKSYNYYEKLVYEDLLKNGVDFNGKKEIGIKNIRDNIVAIVVDNELFAYREVIDDIVLGYLNIRDGVRADDLYEDFFKYTDYIEVSHLTYIKKSDKLKNKPVPIDIYSKEYLKLFEDINFYINSFFRSEDIKRAKSRSKELREDLILDLVSISKIRLKEFLYLRQEEVINENLYKKYLFEIINYLPKQCDENRYDTFDGESGFYSVKIDGKKLIAIEKPAKNIDAEEIEWYFKYRYIDEKLKDECLEIIKKRDS